MSVKDFQVTNISILQNMTSGVTSVPQLPTDLRRIVVFDTGAYRDYVRSGTCEDNRQRGARLRTAERASGIYAFMSPLVTWELVAHLADPADKDRDHCMKALCVLANHTRSTEVPGDPLWLVPGTEVTLCRALFGAPAPAYEAQDQELQKLAVHVGLHAPEIVDSVAVNNIKAFSDSMASQEASWREGMVAFQEMVNEIVGQEIEKGIDEKETMRSLRSAVDTSTWEVAYAITVLVRSANLIGREIEAQEFAGAVKFLRDVFGTPWKHAIILLRKFMVKGAPDIRTASRKWENFVWDNGLSFLLGNQHFLQGRDIRLVTADKEIHSGATEAGCTERIIRLADYLKEIGLEE